MASGCWENGSKARPARLVRRGTVSSAVEGAGPMDRRGVSDRGAPIATGASETAPVRAAPVHPIILVRPSDVPNGPIAPVRPMVRHSLIGRTISATIRSNKSK